MSTRQRYEINIAYVDKGGTKRFTNRVGTLWFDGTSGTIEIPPGVALMGGAHYLNVDLPREQRQGGAQQQQQQRNTRATGGWDIPDDDG
jgi:hypothetical protein